MTYIVRSSLIFCMVLAGLTGETAHAQPKAKVVEPRLIWEQQAHNSPTDLVRFKDQWFAVTREGNAGFEAASEIRVIASADGVKWKSVGLLKGPTPRNLHHPRLAVSLDGQLAVWAGAGSTPAVQVQTFGWYSKDGANWSDAQPVAFADHWVDRFAVHKGTAYAFCHGCICGNAQTVRILSSRDGKNFERIYEETFRGFFPDTGAFLFDGDTAICLFSRPGAIGVGRTGLLAVSKAPYTAWEWKETDMPITAPRLVRTPDGKTIAAVGTFDKGTRTILCEVDPAQAKLTELLELPTGGAHVFAGLAMHDGQMWVSFHSSHDGKTGLYLAKIQRSEK